VIKPSIPQFTGKVYILTDGRTYSASTDFVAIASRLDNVLVIGEETCGAYRSYISGTMFGLELPNSDIGIKIPAWKTILAFEEDPLNRGRGVFPDYPVSASLIDFINGTDVTNEFAYKLISTKK
jgi:C-terminal processing protease CtpA/Prc